MPLYDSMFLISKGEYISLKRIREDHAHLVDSIGGDVNGGQVNHIEIGEGGKVVIKPDQLSASGKSTKAKPSRPSPSRSSSSETPSHPLSSTINNNFTPISSPQASMHSSIQDEQDKSAARFKPLPQDSFDDPGLPQPRLNRSYPTRDVAAQVDLPKAATVDGFAQANLGPETSDGSTQVRPETSDGSTQANIRPEARDGAVQAKPKTRDGAVQANIKPKSKDGSAQTNDIPPMVVKPKTRDGSAQANIRPKTWDGSSQANLKPTSRDSYSQTNSNQFRSFSTQTSRNEKDGLQMSKSKAMASAVADANKNAMSKHGKKRLRVLPNRVAHTDATDGSAPTVNTLLGKKLKDDQLGQTIPFIQPPRSSSRGVKNRTIAHGKKSNVLVITHPKTSTSTKKNSNNPPTMANKNKVSPPGKPVNKKNSGKKDATWNKKRPSNYATVPIKKTSITKMKNTTKKASTSKHASRKNAAESLLIQRRTEDHLNRLAGEEDVDMEDGEIVCENVADSAPEKKSKTIKQKPPKAVSIRGKRPKVPLDNSEEDEDYIPRKTHVYSKKRSKRTKRFDLNVLD